DAVAGDPGGRVQGRRDVPGADGREGGAAAGLHPEARPGGQGDRLPRGLKTGTRTSYADKTADEEDRTETGLNAKADSALYLTLSFSDPLHPRSYPRTKSAYRCFLFTARSPPAASAAWCRRGRGRTGSGSGSGGRSAPTAGRCPAPTGRSRRASRRARAPCSTSAPGPTGRRAPPPPGPPPPAP